MPINCDPDDKAVFRTFASLGHFSWHQLVALLMIGQRRESFFISRNQIKEEQNPSQIAAMSAHEEER